MKIKIIIATLLLISIFCITGCNNTFNTKYVRVQTEWVSPDGVHYWVLFNNGSSSITPRYDNNGNLVIDKGEYDG